MNIVEEPYWWSESEPPQQTDPRSLPEEVDVMVIGAGLTGLSAARTLAKAGKSVLAVDEGPPGIGASSRNGGMIGGGHRVAPDILRDRYGMELAAQLIHELHIDSTAFCLSLMEEEKIECDFQKSGRYLAQWLPSHFEKNARNLDLIQSLAPVEAEVISRPQQLRELASDRYFGGILHHFHGGLNPAKWVAGLRKAAERAGALVQGGTPVSGIDKDGAQFRVMTPRSSVRCGSVLVATNGYTRGRHGSVGNRVFPVPSFIIVTAELGKQKMRSLIPNGRMIVETRERHCYYRPSPDGRRLVFGGRAALFQASNAFFTRELKQLMTGIFPDLQETEISHCWKGNTGFTFETSPHVGRLDGIWHALGYCGNGNGMAPYLGHKAALQILGDAEGETAFSKIPIPGRWWFRGSPWFLPFADVTFRARDIWSNFQNRRSRTAG